MYTNTPWPITVTDKPKDRLDISVDTELPEIGHRILNKIPGDIADFDSPYELGRYLLSRLVTVVILLRDPSHTEWFVELLSKGLVGS